MNGHAGTSVSPYPQQSIPAEAVIQDIWIPVFTGMTRANWQRPPILTYAIQSIPTKVCIQDISGFRFSTEWKLMNPIEQLGRQCPLHNTIHTGESRYPAYMD